MGANHDILHFGSQPDGRTPTSPYQTARVPPPDRNHQTRVACPIALFAGAVGALSASKKHRCHHTTLGRLPARAKTTVLAGARFTSPSNTARQPNRARDVHLAWPYYQSNNEGHDRTPWEDTVGGPDCIRLAPASPPHRNAHRTTT